MDKITIISKKSMPRAFDIREFLYRHIVDFTFIEEGDEDFNQLVIDKQLQGSTFPVIIFPNGRFLQDPELFQIAEELGLHRKPKKAAYEVAIMGAGPAGLTAAIYAGSEGLSTVVIEKHSPGGQAGSTSVIENLIAHPEGITGAEFTERSRKQAERFGVEFVTPVELTGIDIRDKILHLTLSSGHTFAAKSLVVAVGVRYRVLTVPGIEKFVGKSIFYGAALTEGRKNQDKEVYVVGGANSAGQAAMYFSRFAKTVNLIVRGDSISQKMSSYLVDQISEKENINVCTHSEIVSLEGGEQLENIHIKDLISGETKVQPANNVFLLLGGEPYTECMVGKFFRDKNGFLLTGNQVEKFSEFRNNWKLNRKPFSLETNIPGVFAAGDVRMGTAKRMSAAIGDGANAVTQVHEYLRSLYI